MKKGWEEKKLGEVLKLEYGKPLPKEKRKPNGRYPVYGANGEINRSDDFYFDKYSIIVGRKGSAGEVNLTEEKFWPLDVTYYAVFDEKKYDLKFFYYLLGHLEIPKYAKGVKPGINRNEVYSIRIKVPSLKEQQHIVAILDEAFAAIDQAKENAEKNLNNARELFDSYLQSVFANPGEGWEEKKLGDMCNIIGGGTPSKSKSEYYNGDILWATVRDMKNKIIKTTEYKITAKAVKNSATNIIPKNNVIIATRVGLGKVCLLEKDTAINQDLKAIIPKSNTTIYVPFLYYWLTSVAEYIQKSGNGATVQGVKLTFIKNMLITLPAFSQQQQIVDKLDALSAETKKLEAIYEKKLADLEELKKSILEKAFKGEL